MSVVRCEECERQIDLDFDSEHFISEHESLVLAGRCADNLTDADAEEFA
jgi:hypothetical protein